jgi:hypothetical protein
MGLATQAGQRRELLERTNCRCAVIGSLAPVSTYVSKNLKTLFGICAQVVIERAKEAQNHRIGAVHSNVFVKTEASYWNHPGVLAAAFRYL